jgi:anaerobic magnesium-protoporphyrin IX monomethyl ester cyclase
MAKIALISPPFMKDYMRNARCDFVSLSKSSWFPIWLGQAGAYLESRGHKTVLLDSQVTGETKNQALSRVREFDADIVAVYTGRLSEESDIGFADTLAAEGRTVVFVGPYASIDPQALLEKAGATSIAIQKEFEQPLDELARGAAIETTPNVWVRGKGGGIHFTAPRPLLKTPVLDTFPITSEYLNRHIKITDYKAPSELYPFIDVMSGRGCAWGKCNFCLWVQTFVDGSVYNLRSIDHFMQEFEYIRDHLPHIKGVMIQDDMLTHGRAREIAEGILKRDIKIRWSCYAKPNSKFTQDTLHLMRRSGCLNLHVGFESGDDEMLKNIDKGSTVEQAKEFADMAHRADLQIHGDFAIGHFGETRETMMKTLELAKAINPHTAQFQIMIPFKGTKYYQQLESIGGFNEKGEPSYEKLGGVTAEEIRAFAKYAYRRFYFSGSYMRKILKNPKNYFFNRFDQYLRALPAMTWKEWVK